jgi:hypothetical protein
MHGDVYANGQKIERFRTSWVNNPFESHYNSKLFSRYMGTRVPATLIKQTDKFLTLEIDLQENDEGIYLREVGSHDIF